MLRRRVIQWWHRADTRFQRRPWARAPGGEAAAAAGGEGGEGGGGGATQVLLIVLHELAGPLMASSHENLA